MYIVYVARRLNSSTLDHEVFSILLSLGCDSWHSSDNLDVYILPAIFGNHFIVERLHCCCMISFV